MATFLELNTAPAADAVTDAELYDHLRVTLEGSPAAPTDETYIQAIKAAAIAYVDGAGGILNRALVTQTWTLHLDRFPTLQWAPGMGFREFDAKIELPLPPLVSVESVKYYDTAGSLQTLSASVYTVITRQRQRSFIVLTPNQSWPSVQVRPAAVQVKYNAGYGAANTDVPADLRQAILQMAAHWYEHRLPVEVGMTSAEVPFTAAAIFDKYTTQRIV